MKCTLLWSCVGLFVMSPVLQGSMVVNVDFQGSGEVMSGGGASAVIPFQGSYWNASGVASQPFWGSPSMFPLLGSTGTASGISLSMNASAYDREGEGDALFRDAIVGEATLYGLTPGQDYHIVIYDGANLEGIARVAQPFDMHSPGYGEVNCLYELTALPGVNGCDYFEGEATADAAGTLELRVSPGAMAGLQIVLNNPEPSSGMLAILGALGLLGRRRG